MVSLSVLRVGIFYKNPSKSVTTLSKLPYFVLKVLGDPKKSKSCAKVLGNSCRCCIISIR